MSLSSVILFAFIMVSIFGYKSGCKFIYSFLSRRRSCTHKEIRDSLDVERDSLSFLNLVLLKNNDIQEEVRKIIENANYKADSLIKNKEEQIEKMLDSYQNFITSKIESRISEAVRKLVSDSAVVAAKVTEKLIQEYVGDENNNSEIVSSLSRNLGKKMH